MKRCFWGEVFFDFEDQEKERGEDIQKTPLPFLFIPPIHNLNPQAHRTTHHPPPPPPEFCTQPKPIPPHPRISLCFIFSPTPTAKHEPPLIPYTCLLSLYKWVLETPRSRHVGVFVPRSRTKRWLTFRLHRTMAGKDLPPVFLVPPIVFLRPPCHNLSVPAVSHRETAIETVVLHHPTPTNCPIRIGISWQTY